VLLLLVGEDLGDLKTAAAVFLSAAEIVNTDCDDAIAAVV